MTSTTQGNGAGSRSNWRVPSQSESPTLARSSCSHLAPLRARLRASRSLLLTRGSPKPSSHLLSRAMLLFSILNLASRLTTSSRRVKTRCPADLPEMAVERCLPSSVIRRPSDAVARTLCVVRHKRCDHQVRCCYDSGRLCQRVYDNKVCVTRFWPRDRRRRCGYRNLSPTRVAIYNSAVGSIACKRERATPAQLRSQFAEAALKLDKRPPEFERSITNCYRANAPIL